MQAINSNIKNDFQKEYLEFYENIYPKLVKEKEEFLSSNPERPDEAIAQLRFDVHTVAKSGLFQKYGINKPIDKQEASNIYIRDDFITSFDSSKIPIRIYRPSGYDSLLPVYFNFHGGGYAYGDLLWDMDFLTQVCLRTNKIIIDVDYRLLPDYAYPTPIFDGYSAVKYIFLNHEKFGIDRSNISCGGFSAGGEMALIVAHLCKESNIPLNLVVANFPKVENYSMIKDAKDAKFNGSTIRYENGLPPLWKELLYFEDLKRDSCKEGAQINLDSIIYKELDYRSNPNVLTYITDLFRVKNFENMPRHLITTGGCDILKDGGRAYSEILIEQEVEVHYYCVSGFPHDFYDYKDYFQQGEKFKNLMVKEITDW